ncbi:PEPxxWA-CTERM sorting domain-containing protein [Gimibacter soli]|uniref:PEPxxWA-CTERM sorting domain-containing protein n=1 Tax=Gimibacter soli TaxID=3024400 RepID=A0AAF0BM43_9PROT|nr:PEPxxWA-CTERM sorting domain-containing protein [Gimibacter soli]WCL54016.1 PEPxxWA-CTERM sorting domain-containing protein [Gimibacter soli]
MAILKKAAAAVLAMGLSAGSQAAVQTFNLTGNVEFWTEEAAASFGVVEGTVGRFDFSFDLDTALPPGYSTTMNTASDGTPFHHANYYGNNFTGHLGNQQVTLDRVIVIVTDAKGYLGPYSDRVSIDATVGFNADLGIYEPLQLASGKSSHGMTFNVGMPFDSIDDFGIQHFLDFNSLGGTRYGGTLGEGGNFAINSNFYQFTDIQLSVAGVPEPATWLTLIMGFGLAGVAVRRRRLACVAQ